MVRSVMNQAFAVLFLLVIILLSVVGHQIAEIRRRLGAQSRLEAKVDLLLSHAGLTYSPFDHLPPTVAAALQHGDGKIAVIKLYREATGVGLREAKDIIDEVMRRTGKIE
jgi:ribosomal protein L7/L12